METRTVTTRDATSTAVVTAPEETATERANRLFLTRVQDIPGVVHIETFGGETIGEQSFHVYVCDGDLDAEYSVYRVQGEIYDQIPDARLCVELLEESDIAEHILNAAAADRWLRLVPTGTVVRR